MNVVEGKNANCAQEINESRLVVAGLFLSGFIIFSPFSSWLLIDVLGLPFSLPEIFMIPFWLLFRRMLDLRVNFSAGALVGAGMIFFGVGIGGLVGEYPLYSICATARAYVDILLWYMLLSGSRRINFCHVTWLAIGSICGWLFVSRIKLGLLQQGGSDSIAVAGGLVPLSLVLVTTIVFAKYRLLIFALCVGLMTSFFSGVRRQIFSLVVSFLGGMGLAFSIKRFLTLGILAGIILGGVIASWGTLGEIAKEQAPMLYVRVFQRTQHLFEGNVETTGDTTRILAVLDCFSTTTLGDNLLPRGFVSKRTNVDAGTGIYNDVPMMELYHTFGFWGAWIICGIYLLYVLKHLRRAIFLKNKSSAVWTVVGGHMFLLLFLEGGFLAYPYLSLFTALALVNVFRTHDMPYLWQRECGCVKEQEELIRR